VSRIRGGSRAAHRAGGNGVKLLFDANLSIRLVSSLDDLYPDSTHVSVQGGITANDAEIWQIAKRDGYTIATKDTDFLELSLLRGAPPKVVLLRVGNVSTARIEQLLRQHADRVRQFIAVPDQAVLIVHR
jgi:predicted nuclease of predicted toxin-antitoxin system